jgi:hypothetical protein
VEKQVDFFVKAGGFLPRSLSYQIRVHQNVKSFEMPLNIEK